MPLFPFFTATQSTTFPLAKNLSEETVTTHLNFLQYLTESEHANNPKVDPNDFHQSLQFQQKGKIRSAGYVHVIKATKQVHINLIGTDPDNKDDVLADVEIEIEWVKKTLAIHRGFLERFRLIKPAIFKALDDFRQQSNLESISEYEMIIGGHSLGGAVAQILTWHLINDNSTQWLNSTADYQTNSRNRYKCITIGGARTFIGPVDLNFDNFLRFIHSGDPVPFIPVRAFPLPLLFNPVGLYYSVEFKDDTKSKVVGCLSGILPQKIVANHSRLRYSTYSLASYINGPKQE